MARTYRELIVWQKAMALAEAVYGVANRLPDIERYGLAAQMRRSAISVPSNIAEGHERRSRAEYRRFVAIACGSLAELETQLDLAQRLYAVEGAMMKCSIELADETGRLLRAIERGLRGTTAEEGSVQAGPQPSALSPDP